MPPEPKGAASMATPRADRLDGIDPTGLLDHGAHAYGGGARESLAAQAAISVERLTKRYGSGRGAVLAASEISFEVRAGEAFALLGQNGAGKSTIIRTIATLIRPDAGRVLLNGRDVVIDPVGARSSLGVALQGTGVPRRQTARQLIGYHARLHGLGRAVAHARTVELVNSFGLNEVADRTVSTYSGGSVVASTSRSPSSTVPASSCSTSRRRGLTSAPAARCGSS